MQMDIFLSPLGCTLLIAPGRTELHCIIRSCSWPGDFCMLVLPAENKGAGNRKAKKCMLFCAFMQLCLRIATPRVKDHGICVNIGSVVLVACTKKAKGTCPKLSLKSVCPVLDSGSTGVDFMFTCATEAVVSTTK